VGSLNFSLT